MKRHLRSTKKGFFSFAILLAGIAYAPLSSYGTEAFENKPQQVVENNLSAEEVLTIEEEEDDTANDPFESFNRVMFSFNMQLDKYILRPLAEIYQGVTPTPVRKGVSNFLANLTSPLTFLNDVLQGAGKNAQDTLGRFMLNTIMGVGGIFDVATELGLEAHREDFGQTLAVWGMGSGPYLVLPFFGPSSPRDAVGMVSDFYIDPINYWLRQTDHKSYIYVRDGAAIIVKRAQNLESFDTLEKNSVDLYATVRSLYWQNRNALINNDQTADWEDLPAPDFEEDEDEWDTSVSKEVS